MCMLKLLYVCIHIQVNWITCVMLQKYIFTVLILFYCRCDGAQKQLWLEIFLSFSKSARLCALF